MYFDFNHDTTVRLQAFNGFLATYALAIDNRLVFAFTDGMQTILFDTLADQVFLDLVGTALREVLVIFGITDTIGMAGDQQQLDFWMSLHLADDFVIQLSLAFWLQRVLVECEEHFRRKRDLLESWLCWAVQPEAR